MKIWSEGVGNERMKNKGYFSKGLFAQKAFIAYKTKGKRVIFPRNVDRKKNSAIRSKAICKESPVNFFLWKTGENHHIHIQFTRINDVEHHLLLKIDTDMYLEREFSCSFFVPAQFQQNLNSFTYVFSFLFLSLSQSTFIYRNMSFP